MYTRKIKILFILFTILNTVYCLICWSCSNNPHDIGKNPCPDNFKYSNINLVQKEYCTKGNCFLKMARRDKGPLIPFKSGCIHTNKSESIHYGKCQSGVGLEMVMNGDNKLPKHFTSNFCTIICDSDLCNYRLAKKFGA